MLAVAQPLYIDAFPLTQFSMYGSLAIRPIKRALLQLKAEGKLDRAKMVVLTNCTFDGHVANVKRTMLECLAIKPDLVFLWDEAWFGFARFSPFLRRRTAMGAAAAIRELMRDPEYRKRYEAFKVSVGKLDPKDPKLLDMELLPDPDQIRVRVYETDSVHKSMSSLRQGSIIVVADQDFHTVEASFKEAFFTHTSTSPNLQIIASLDVARRQMELEGYELVGRAIQLAIEARREINGHPLISKYFRAATPAEMVPAEYRKSGFIDWGAPGWTMTDTIGALDNDEFYLDPTRITLLCGTAGYDGTQFKALATRAGMRLLALPSRSVNRLVAENAGLVAMTLPANTYPGQGEPVATVATVALLVGTADAPDAEVEKVLGFVFARADLAAGGSAEGVKVSKDSGLRSITIPLHPGASRFFGTRIP